MTDLVSNKSELSHQLGRALIGVVVFGGVAAACVFTGGLPLIVALPIIAKIGIVACYAAIGGVLGAFWHKRNVKMVTPGIFGFTVCGGITAAISFPLVLPILGLAAYGGLFGGLIGYCLVKRDEEGLIPRKVDQRRIPSNNDSITQS